MRAAVICSPKPGAMNSFDVDIREHFLASEDRQWHPTKKGIMVLPELLPHVIGGVEALEDVCELGTVATIPKSSRVFTGPHVRRASRRASHIFFVGTLLLHAQHRMWKDAAMRTTVDLPDDLLQAVEVRAGVEGLHLGEYIERICDSLSPSRHPATPGA